MEDGGKRMSEREYAPGTFCWADVATPDADGAKRFYSRLFGWDYVDEDAGDHGVYTMITLDGRNVGGMYQMNQQMLDQGVPPYWQPYVSVADVEEACGRVAAAGGSVAMPALDVMDSGRMALITDTEGAVTALWEPKQHQGADLMDEFGGICWNELYTRDLEAAKRFYAQMFGWSAQTAPVEPGREYTTFSKDGAMKAGALEIQPEWENSAPGWGLYFLVPDLDATLKEVEDSGGNVWMPPESIEGVGRFSVVADPQQAYFCLIQPPAQG
jgi:hypothetical protein